MPVCNLKTMTPRQQVFKELVTTESNYVGILNSVTKIAEVSQLRTNHVSKYLYNPIFMTF